MKVSNKVLILLLIATGLNAEYAFADPSASQNKPALSEIQRIELSKVSAPIKSAAELDVYLATKGVGNTPFSKLPATKRSLFIQSLTFNEKGLTGFDYKILESELTPTDIYKILSLFGFQHLTSRLKGAVIRTPLDAAIMNSSAVTTSNLKPSLGGTVTPLSDGGGYYSGDHEGYACTSRATCTSAVSSICTSNC